MKRKSIGACNISRQQEKLADLNTALDYTSGTVFNLSFMSACRSKPFRPQCRMIGISTGKNRATAGRKKEINSDNKKITGITRLLYKPSFIRAGDILCVSKLRSGLLICNHSQQFINPVKHILAT